MKPFLVAGVTILASAALLGGCGRGKSPETKLADAAATGDTVQIQRLLASGVNVNCRSPAVKYGAPLIWAVVERQEKAVKLLLDSGADPDAQTATGKDALELAIGSEEETTGQIISYLVVAGARVDAYTNYFLRLPAGNSNRVAFEAAIQERLTKKAGGMNRSRP